MVLCNARLRLSLRDQAKAGTGRLVLHGLGRTRRIRKASVPDAPRDCRSAAASSRDSCPEVWSDQLLTHTGDGSERREGNGMSRWLCALFGGVAVVAIAAFFWTANTKEGPTQCRANPRPRTGRSPPRWRFPREGTSRTRLSRGVTGRSSQDPGLLRLLARGCVSQVWLELGDGANATGLSEGHPRMAYHECHLWRRNDD